jgi:hypothetical protein
MRWLVATCVVAFAVALVGAGCGGGDESSGNTAATLTDTTATDETTTDETTTDAGTTTDATDLSALTSEDCLAFIGAAAAVGQAFSGTSGNVDQSKFFAKYADRVPEEIKADLQVMADAGAAASAAYSKLDLKPGETPSAEQMAQYTAALEAIDQEEFNAASQRVGAWTEEVCPAGG